MSEHGETRAVGDGCRSIWLLSLIPPLRGGRWLAAAGTLVVLLPLFSVCGAFGGLFVDGDAWAAALFFCTILAYITPVFHFVTERTEAAFDALAPRLAMTPEQLAAARAGIRCKSPRWVAATATGAILVWLLQSWLLAGGTARVFTAMFDDRLSLVMSLAPLFVWLFMVTAITALLDNASLFRRLAEGIEVDLLDPEALMPFGYMAASSLLVMVGALASLSIMWLGGATDPWTTIPGVVMLLGSLLFLAAATLWPVHRVLRTARRGELRRVQARIDALREGARSLDEAALAALAPLLVYRREIAAVSEWPLDVGVLTRFGLYLFIVPLTWVGAALIEFLVQRFIES